jgi:hypothetical protein
MERQHKLRWMSKGQVDPKGISIDNNSRKSGSPQSSKPRESWIGWHAEDSWLFSTMFWIKNAEGGSWERLFVVILFNGTYSSSTRDFAHLQHYYWRQLAICSHPILDSCIALTSLLLLPIYYLWKYVRVLALSEICDLYLHYIRES